MTESFKHARTLSAEYLKQLVHVTNVSWAETWAIEGIKDGWILDEDDDEMPVRTTLPQPKLNDGTNVTGTTKKVHCIENKWKRIACQEEEGKETIQYWRQHKGEFSVPMPKQIPAMW